MDGFHITIHPLIEIKWLTQRLQHPYINIKTSLCYIHRLYLLNITDITQLIQNCGTKLMTIQDIKRLYGPLTNIMHKTTNFILQAHMYHNLSYHLLLTCSPSHPPSRLSYTPTKPINPTNSHIRTTHLIHPIPTYMESN